MGANRSSIIIPLSSMQQFHEMVGHFLKCSNKSVTRTNLKQSSGHYISKSKELDAEEDSAPGQENWEPDFRGFEITVIYCFTLHFKIVWYWPFYSIQKNYRRYPIPALNSIFIFIFFTTSWGFILDL